MSGTREFNQDGETSRQLRSRIVQTLNVPQRVRLGPSLAAALLDDSFDHPANPHIGDTHKYLRLSVADYHSSGGDRV